MIQEVFAKIHAQRNELPTQFTAADIGAIRTTATKGATSFVFVLSIANVTKTGVCVNQLNHAIALANDMTRCKEVDETDSIVDKEIEIEATNCVCEQPIGFE